MKSERLVTVCDRCYRASCWQGERYCEEYRHAGAVEVPASVLRQRHLERPSWYSVERIRMVEGTL